MLSMRSGASDLVHMQYHSATYVQQTPLVYRLQTPVTLSHQ